MTHTDGTFDIKLTFLAQKETFEDANVSGRFVDKQFQGI